MLLMLVSGHNRFQFGQKIGDKVRPVAGDKHHYKIEKDYNNYYQQIYPFTAKVFNEKIMRLKQVKIRQTKYTFVRVSCSL